MVEANGGQIVSGVSAKLNYLVVGEDAGSKLDKAKKTEYYQNNFGSRIFTNDKIIFPCYKIQP
jgi:hypothetical protein